MFLNTHDLTKLDQETVKHLNKSIKSNEIKAVIRILLTNKKLKPDIFTVEVYKTFK